MSAWPGKFVIGLTGNIATGKSVVRKMLEHLGAYGIDADALGHRAIAKDAPGYKAVVDTFGKWILTPDGQVDRGKLARVVFSDPDALNQLESIVHPLVRQAINLLIRRSSQKVIVVEAIKLLEGPLRQACDTIWVTYAQKPTQIARLIKKRNLSVAVAHQRVNSQPPQDEKVKVANTVIQNEGTFEDTWQQVTRAWKVLFPTFDSG
ncbi:MAG: dephospho-CoA kinase, partial [Chloroflexi bacterium RBG_19FT_COMBO_50_10]